MPRCCQGATCACAIEAGLNISIVGVGSANDPYVVSADAAIAVQDNSVFNLTITGGGTTVNPWVLSTNFAATAKLDDIPDVNATTPANAQVLGWDSATSKWTARAPTTAASGSVQHDTSLSGDGSGGSPLQVVEEPNGYLATGGAGLGLSVTGKNRLIQHYVNSTARATGTAPDLNTLTMLDTAPGRVDYWNGVAWVERLEVRRDVGTGQFLDLSGPYTGGSVRQMFRQISTTTDALGQFDLLSAADLTGYAGVLTVHFQPTGSPAYTCMVLNALSHVVGEAHTLSDGGAYVSQAITGVVTAWLY